MQKYKTIRVTAELHEYIKTKVKDTYEEEHPDDKRFKDFGFLVERALKYYVNH